MKYMEYEPDNHDQFVTFYSNLIREYERSNTNKMIIIVLLASSLCVVTVLFILYALYSAL